VIMIVIKMINEKCSRFTVNYDILELTPIFVVLFEFLVFVGFVIIGFFFIVVPFPFVGFVIYSESLFVGMN